MTPIKPIVRLIYSPRVLGEGFASDLLEMGVIDDASWTVVANVIATAIEEDRLQSKRSAKDLPAHAVARALVAAGIVRFLCTEEAADLIAIGIANDRELRPRNEEETLP